MKISIVIADDHELFRDGLRHLLNKQQDFVVIGEATSGTELIGIAEKKVPDVIITDLYMPEINGHQAILFLHNRFPHIKFIALSVSDDEYAIADMMLAGAKGYLVKECAPREIVAAVRDVLDGQTYFCRHTASKTSSLIKKDKCNLELLKIAVPQFSVNEKAILKYICLEYTSKEMAFEMRMSFRTVESYRDALFKKTGTKNAAGLAAFAVRHGFDC